MKPTSWYVIEAKICVLGFPRGVNSVPRFVGFALARGGQAEQEFQISAELFNIVVQNIVASAASPASANLARWTHKTVPHLRIEAASGAWAAFASARSGEKSLAMRAKKSWQMSPISGLVNANSWANTPMRQPLVTWSCRRLIPSRNPAGQTPGRADRPASERAPVRNFPLLPQGNAPRRPWQCHLCS